MPDLIDTLGVQSYCFRGHKANADVARLVRDAGLGRVELCSVHASFDDPKGFGDVVKVYRDAGVQIISIGVQTFTGADTEATWFECAAAAGAKHVSAHFKVDTFTTAVPKTAALADRHGMTVGLHCHGGYMFGGSPDVIRHVLDLGGGRVGLCLDTAWAMQIGPRNGDPVRWAAETFRGRLSMVHVKDFVFDRDAQWHDVVVGTGNLDLPRLLTTLRDTAFTGPLVLEYEGDVENPLPALRDCVRAIRAAI